MVLRLCCCRVLCRCSKGGLLQQVPDALSSGSQRTPGSCIHHDGENGGGSASCSIHQPQLWSPSQSRMMSVLSRTRLARVAARKALAWLMRGPFLVSGACWSLPLRCPWSTATGFGLWSCQMSTTNTRWTRGFHCRAGTENCTAQRLPRVHHDAVFARVQRSNSHMTRGTSSRFYFQGLRPVIQSWLPLIPYMFNLAHDSSNL